jgi:hypothetical protein
MSFFARYHSVFAVTYVRCCWFCCVSYFLNYTTRTLETAELVEAVSIRKTELLARLLRASRNVTGEKFWLAESLLVVGVAQCYGITLKRIT